MKRLVLHKPGDVLPNADVRVETCDVPLPRSGEVLIKVCAAPVNPSDYGAWWKKSSMKAKGTERPSGSDRKFHPIGMGSEGCGVVVASGGGLMANKCLGKNVGFIGLKNGQYFINLPININ